MHKIRNAFVLFVLLLLLPQKSQASLYDQDVLSIFSKLIPRFVLMSSQKEQIEEEIGICILRDPMDKSGVDSLIQKINDNYPQGIKHYPITIAQTGFADLGACKEKQIAFLFDSDQKIITKTVEQLNHFHLLTVSYNPNYLKNGVAVSLSIERKVMPLLNMDVITKNKIAIDTLLLRVSKVYRSEDE